MLIQVDKLKRSPRQLVVDEEAAYFPALADLIKQGEQSFHAPIKGAVEAAWSGKMIRVTGSLATTVSSLCSRCLSEVVTDLDFPVSLTYASKPAEDDASLSEEIEIQGDELGLIYFAGNEIELRADLAQEVIMALPQQVLCGDDCKGLCPVCGCNLNKDRCECDAPVFHSGLAALKNFKLKD